MLEIMALRYNINHIGNTVIPGRPMRCPMTVFEIQLTGTGIPNNLAYDPDP